MKFGRAASPSRKDLWDRLSSVDSEFAIFPIPEYEAVSSGAVDLHLGNTFLSAERSSIQALRSKEPWEAGRLFREVRVTADRPFMMQPNQFVLAATLEYISMPLDLAGLIESRSTYGRMGLIAATAAYVNPGFKGCPTLEVVNVGEVPVELYAYTDICQLVLFTSDERVFKPSRYQCSTRPHFAKHQVRDAD